MNLHLFNNNTFATVVGLIGSLLGTLMLGSYIYTWNALADERKEKTEWRDKHNEQLDKRFSEVKQSQEKLTDAVNRSYDKTSELLEQLLDEQRKANQLMRANSQPRRER